MKRTVWTLVGALFPLLAGAQVSRVDAPELAATIAGRVCLDADADGRCGADEAGLANVRLVLATGREVRTDAQGRYHFTGVDARTPDATGGLHLRPGRHRVRVDARTLPAASRATPEGATVEVSWGAVVLQDFPVRTSAEPVKPLTRDYAEAPPAAAVAPAGVRFLVTGQASPGDTVKVAGVEAEVEPGGGYRALVELPPGSNELPITATSPGGTVRLFRQRIDVVEREGGFLVVPRDIDTTGAVRLPGGRDEPAATGASSLRLEAPEGTTVRTPEGEARVGPEGSVQVPVTLAPGANTVPLTLRAPGEPERTVAVELSAAPQPFAVGLLDVEGAYRLGEGFELRGRGAAHAEARLGAFELVGELDLRDTDFRAPRGGDATGWLRPRRPERFDWWLDPDLAVAEWGDESTSLTPNAAEGRLRLEARHDTHGRAGFGTYRALQADGEVGRYHRPLFGPYAELKLGEEKGPRVGLDAFAGSLADPTRQLASVPAHEEFPATGGSLYSLGAAAVAEGSELLRVELRDGVTGLPLAEQHLVRGRDYEIDYLAGRVLMARPLSFLVGTPWLRTGALTDAPEPVLVIDYAALRVGDARDALGGEAWAEWGGARVSLGAVRERRAGAPFQLLTAKARGGVGPYTLLAEVARSRGLALAAESYGLSEDGGLTFLRPAEGVFSGGGDALTLRLRGPGPLGDGSLDAAFRRRTRGFSDTSHVDTVAFRQLSLRAAQPLGPFSLTLLGDDKRAVDPRLPFSDVPYEARTVGASVGYDLRAWGARLEVRDARLLAAEAVGEGPLLSGGRTSVGLEGRISLNDRVVLSVGHRETVSLRGEGPGRLEDTFTSAGVEVKLDEDTNVGVRGGYGPELGPQVWAHASVRRGPDVYYGGYSVDVDGPDVGVGRAVTGARTDLGDGTSVFVEDVTAHDATAVRQARAVGLRQTAFGGWELGARWERGVRHPLGLRGPLDRDVASVFAQWVGSRCRVDGRAELRHERGARGRGPPLSVDRTQLVLALATEATLTEDLSVSGRLNFARTLGTAGLEARLLEGHVGAAWRPQGPMLLVARYGVTRELAPGPRSVFGDRAVQLFSLLPAFEVGERLRVAAGLHAARSSLGGAVVWTGTGTLRPTVRLVGGLEAGVELARRTSSPEGEALTALRAEVGYRVDDRLRVATGYTLLGFSGLGLPGDTEREADRLYLRAEVAY